MALIGEFGAAVQAADPEREPDQFKLNGRVFTVSDTDPTAAFLRFSMAATSGLDTAEMEAFAEVGRMLQAIVVDEDKPEILKHIDGLSVEDMMAVIKAVMEAKAGVPTKQSSDSSDGLPATGPSSREASPSAAEDPWKVGLVPVDQAARGISLVG